MIKYYTNQNVILSYCIFINLYIKSILPQKVHHQTIKFFCIRKKTLILLSVIHKINPLFAGPLLRDLDETDLQDCAGTSLRYRNQSGTALRHCNRR